MPAEVKHFIGSAGAWAALSTPEQAAYSGTYTGLSAWEAAQQGDFVAGDVVKIGELADETFTENVLFLGATTDAARRWVIRPRAGSAFGGDVTAGPLVTSSGSGSTLQMREDALIEDIRIQGPSGQTGQAFAAFQFDNNLTIDVKRCYISSLTTNDVSLISCGNQAASQLNVESCLIGPAGAYGLSCTGSSASINVRNSVFADCNQNGSVFRGGLDASKANITATNVVAFNNNNADFIGTSATLINCASSDSSAYGTSPLTGIASADFANAAGSDFHLSASSSLIGAGANLAGLVAADIDGEAWPGAGAWDIGFDYYTGGGGVVSADVGLAVEASAVHAVADGSSVSAVAGLALGSEITLGVADGSPLAASVGLAVGADSALPVSAVVAVSADVGLAVEVSAAHAVADGSPVSALVGLAIGAGVALPVADGSPLAVSVGLAVGADSALAVSSGVVVAADVGLAVEVSAAHAVADGSPVSALVGLAVGAGVALPVADSSPLAASVGVGSDSSLALPVLDGSIVVREVGLALAADLALALLPSRSPPARVLGVVAGAGGLSASSGLVHRVTGAPPVLRVN